DQLFGELGALLEEHLALVVDELAVRRLSEQRSLHLTEEGVAKDRRFLVTKLLEACALVIFDVLGALVLLGVFAREDACVDDDAADSRGNPQRRVADVAGFLAEDRA